MKKQKKQWVRAEMGLDIDLDSDEEAEQKLHPDERKEREELKKLNVHQRRIRLERKAKHEAAVAKDMGTALTGQARKALRESLEREDAKQGLFLKVQQENMERDAAADLQRIYRGHIGRKAARRWCMKKAEQAALYALLSASAITAQRVFRGYLGKLKSAEVRSEMAEFIAMIRMEDASNDDNEYWNKHYWERLRRDARAALHKIRGTKPKSYDDDDDGDL